MKKYNKSKDLLNFNLEMILINSLTFKNILDMNEYFSAGYFLIIFSAGEVFQ